MSIIDRFLAVLTPYECVGCRAEGRLLCNRCIQQLSPPAGRCYRCQRPSVDGRTCDSCSPHNTMYRVRAAAGYAAAARELVWKLKFAGARSAAGEMAACLRPLLDDVAVTADATGGAAGSAMGYVALVPVPTAPGRARRRGYDQARLLARELSRQTRLPYLDCLARRGGAHQVGASGSERRRQLRGAFRVRLPEARLRGRRLILIDDVVTTGATLEAAARALRAQGAATVEGLVFAQA